MKFYFIFYILISFLMGCSDNFVVSSGAGSGNDENIEEPRPEPQPEPELEPNPKYNSKGGTLDGKPLSLSPVCTLDNAHCNELKKYFAKGMAAGNLNDWYENRDKNHSLVQIKYHPQVRRIQNEGYGVSTQKYSNKNLIGNASLGTGGQWNMLRSSYNYSSYQVNRLYQQYRDNDHFWYPNVYDYKLNSPNDFDERYSMSLYESSSLGKSGTDRSHVHAFFYAMAALRPWVKEILENKGLLIPTIQMIYRRSYVANDSEYLSSAAHLSAYSKHKHLLELVKLANSIKPTNIPPLIDLEITNETFIKASNPNRLFSTKSEHLYTTPGAISRVYRELGAQQKKISIDLSHSLDVNKRSLSFETKLIRGQADKVSIKKLNAKGSKIEISFEPSEVSEFGLEQRTSSLFVIAFFANNGAFYSAPGFLSVQNETSLKGLSWNSSHDSLTVTRESRGINHVCDTPIWSDEIFDFDNNGNLKSFERKQGKTTQTFNRFGLLEPKSSPGMVRELKYVSYKKYGRNKVKSEPFYSDYRKDSNLDIKNLTLPANSLVVCAVPMENKNTLISKSVNGSIKVSNSRGFTNYTYNPKRNFTGKDYFLVRSDSASDKTSTIVACDIHVR